MEQSPYSNCAYLPNKVYQYVIAILCNTRCLHVGGIDHGIQKKRTLNINGKTSALESACLTLGLYLTRRLSLRSILFHACLDTPFKQPKKL